MRAALGRLAVEGFIHGEASLGYFTKPWTFQEQRDLQALLAIHYVSSLESAGPDAWPEIQTELVALDRAGACAPDLPGAGAAYANAFERFLVGQAVRAGNAAAVEIVRNAADRTHYLRRLDLEDAALRSAMTDAVGRIAEKVMSGDLPTATQIARAHLGEIVARLPALVDRGNLAAQALKFP